jgi:hypothetical protein
MYSIPQALHFFWTSWPRLICICVSDLSSFLVEAGAGLLFKRALSLVVASTFRLPRTEKALTTGSEVFEGVPYLVLLPLSNVNSGGDDGGLDAAKSSEKIALSLGIGVDDMLVEGVDVAGESAMLEICLSYTVTIYTCRRKNIERVVREARDWTRPQFRPRLLESRSAKSLASRESRRFQCCRSSHVTHPTCLRSSWTISIGRSYKCELSSRGTTLIAILSHFHPHKNASLSHGAVTRGSSEVTEWRLVPRLRRSDRGSSDTR